MASGGTAQCQGRTRRIERQRANGKHVNHLHHLIRALPLFRLHSSSLGNSSPLRRCRNHLLHLRHSQANALFLTFPISLLATVLPLGYQIALCCLDSTMNSTLEEGSRVDLKEYLGTAPSFQKYWTLTQDWENPKRYTTEMKESKRLDIVFEQHRLMWCLYLVRLHPSEQDYNDIPLVLRHLDEQLDKCSRAEAGKINSVMYRFISELTVLHQIQSALKPHRPFYPPYRPYFMEISYRSY